MTQMARLLHLSELLAAAAERKVLKCRTTLAQANAAIETAKADAAALRNRIASQKDQVRDLFLGASHARQGVEMLLSDLSGLDRAVVEAEQQIIVAEDERDKAEAALAEAWQLFRAASIKVTRRERIVAEQRQAARRRSEAVAETELLDQWTGQQQQWRAS